MLKYLAVDLTLVLAYLNLTHQIDISWWLVAAPTLTLLAFALGVIGFFVWLDGWPRRS